MKKILILIILLLCAFTGITANADTWNYTWNTSIVEVPLNANINEYKSIPKASLYRNNKYLPDAEISIMNEGDWLYYLCDVDTTKCGDYKVWYKAYETKYKPGTCLGYKNIVTFRVKDMTVPKISFYKDEISLRRGASFDPLSNVIVTDNYSRECEITCLSTADYTKVGDYEIWVAAVDEYNNRGMASYMIHIYETNAPELVFLSSSSFITCELNESVDLKNYFQAVDEIDGDLTSSMIVPLVDTSSVGDKYYTVKVKNKAGLEDSYEVMVRTIDSSIPIINLKNSDVVIDYNYGIDNVDLLSYVDSLIDNGESLPLSKIEVNSNLKPEVGNYSVNYSYSDGINSTSANMKISVISSIAPKIYCSTITAYVSEYPNLIDYVDVYDSSDPNIENSLIIYDDLVDYETAGKYSAEIYAINSSGLETIKKINVVIKDNAVSSTKNYDYTIYLALGAIIVGLIVALIVLLIRRKKQKNSI